jgi:hypothetical protein
MDSSPYGCHSYESGMETKERCFHVHDMEWDKLFDSFCSPISFSEKAHAINSSLSLSLSLSLCLICAWGVAMKVGPLPNAEITFATAWLRGSGRATQFGKLDT